MSDPLRLAVLGMAHDHLWSNLKTLMALDNVELVGAADLNPALRQRFSQETGCPTVYEHWEQLLDRETIDGALVFSATAEHAEIVELCARHGVDAMVEKPMAATLEQADRMLVATRRSGIKLMINWPTAWSRPFRTAQRLIAEKAIGRVWQITWRGGHSGPDEIGCSEEFCGFLFDKEQNGAGAFNDYSGYGASLCVLLMGGSPNSVMGMAGRLVKTHLAVDDNGILVMRYPGALCRLEMTWTEAVAHVPPHDLVVYGTEGTLVAGGQQVHLYTRDDRDGQSIPADPLPAGQANALEHFCACLRDDQEPAGQTNADLSRAAQEIMEAGLRSAVNGVEVALPLEDHLFR